MVGGVGVGSTDTVGFEVVAGPPGRTVDPGTTDDELDVVDVWIVDDVATEPLTVVDVDVLEEPELVGSTSAEPVELHAAIAPTNITATANRTLTNSSLQVHQQHNGLTGHGTHA